MRVRNTRVEINRVKKDIQTSEYLQFGMEGAGKFSKGEVEMSTDEIIL